MEEKTYKFRGKLVFKKEFTKEITAKNQNEAISKFKNQGFSSTEIDHAKHTSDYSEIDIDLIE